MGDHSSKILGTRGTTLLLNNGMHDDDHLCSVNNSRDGILCSFFSYGTKKECSTCMTYAKERVVKKREHIIIHTWRAIKGSFRKPKPLTRTLTCKCCWASHLSRDLDSLLGESRFHSFENRCLSKISTNGTPPCGVLQKRVHHDPLAAFNLKSRLLAWRAHPMLPFDRP